MPAARLHAAAAKRQSGATRPINEGDAPAGPVAPCVRACAGVSVYMIAFVCLCVCATE
jgi:hypothetical protein